VLGTITTVIMALFVLWKTEMLLALFNSDPEVIKAGVIRLDIVCKTCLIYLPTVLISGALKGMERSTLPTMVNIIFVCLTRVAWILFVYPTNPTFEMIFICFPVSWGLASMAQFITYIIVRFTMNKKQRINGGSL
jgi:Na+-driven multidrug efflux pump